MRYKKRYETVYHSPSATRTCSRIKTGFQFESAIFPYDDDDDDDRCSWHFCLLRFIRIPFVSLFIATNIENLSTTVHTSIHLFTVRMCQKTLTVSHFFRYIIILFHPPATFSCIWFGATFWPVCVHLCIVYLVNSSSRFR